MVWLKAIWNFCTHIATGDFIYNELKNPVVWGWSLMSTAGLAIWAAIKELDPIYIVLVAGATLAITLVIILACLSLWDVWVQKRKTKADTPAPESLNKIESTKNTYEQDWNLELEKREPNSGIFIPLNKAAQSLYRDLRGFDPEHKKIIEAESWRNQKDGVLDYFAVTLSEHCALFGERLSLSALEMIPRDKFKENHNYKFKNNFNDLFYSSNTEPEYTGLVVEKESVPKVLDWLKVNDRWGQQ